ncbi:uncharacterized protein A4U43_C03F26420 [Asparagus officinalis]|uniref:DUF834 domain-containing protein n=1 Tax=Asparagus officinalis TaxID=4686 RepID=A0A5P1FD42_ASPOF|nr:uncharacterized protein A4U43_C03F26420 [Asparagus officinalis]
MTARWQGVEELRSGLFEGGEGDGEEVDGVGSEGGASVRQRAARKAVGDERWTTLGAGGSQGVRGSSGAMELEELGEELVVFVMAIKKKKESEMRRRRRRGDEEK